jgi:hypothetical protein
LHCTVITPYPESEAVQLIPSDEYASELNPSPPATQIDPFHATVIHSKKISVPDAEIFQVNPSYEYKTVLVPKPPRTIKVSDKPMTPWSPVIPGGPWSP